MKGVMRRALLLLGAGLALVAGMPAAEADVPSLTVFAAADLGFAFQEIVPRFEKSVGARVSLVLGSSGNLATQIEHGAPADVFFSADQAFVERLAADRKSTRLNSSHGYISYAGFCLKQNKTCRPTAAPPHGRDPMPVPRGPPCST